MYRRRLARSRRPGKRSKVRRYLKKTKKSALKRTITKILNKKLETKYAAFELNNGYVYGNISENYGAAGNPAAGNNFFNLIPTVPQTSTTYPTTSAHNRIGNRITPIKMLTTIQFYFNGNGLDTAQDLSGVKLSGLYEVRSISATPKEFKSYNSWRATGQNNRQGVVGRLLEVGDGTSVRANSVNPTNLIYPISNENWSKHHDKHFIMGKNSGLLNDYYANYNTPLTTARAQNTIRFTTKLPKTLVYDENDGSALPTNAIALWGCYAGMLNNQNGTASTSYDGLLDTDGTSGRPHHPILRWNLRTELWFKDA